MCGIVGLLDARGNDSPAPQERVRNAVEVMRHRGPDDATVEEVGGGAWGMCRLAIRDPSSAGRQPFWHNGIGVIFNGEIYNTDELRQRLAARGHEFHSGCDTEVVVKAYAEFGAAAFGLLDGIFAVAVLDPPANQFVLARDEFGVKPLFVSSTSGRLAFGSEPKALRAVGALDGGIDEEQLVRYLRYQYVPEPGAPWRGVRRLSRGTFEVYALDDLRLEHTGTFRQPSDSDTTQAGDVSSWIDRTDAAVGESVRRQLVSDRPLGVFLSGGIDSTLIAAYASEIHPGLQAFGISVPGWERDEHRFMVEASAHLDVDLTITTLVESDFDRLTARLLDTYDEPFADFSALPTMLVAEAAGQDLRVVLSGDGGDEMFGGYPRYLFAPLAERLGHLPPAALWLAERVMRTAKLGPRWMMARLIDEVRGGGHGYAALLALRTHDEAAALLGRTVCAPWALATIDHERRAWRATEAWADAMAVDADQYLPADIHTKVDRATMSVSLEARVPLLGAPVARLAEWMPPSVKIRDGVQKWPLKELLRRRGFSEEFVHRQKAGFSFPISEWLRRAARRVPEYEELLRSPPAPMDRGLSSASLDALLAGHDNGHAVWSLLVLSGWLTRFGS